MKVKAGKRTRRRPTYEIRKPCPSHGFLKRNVPATITHPIAMVGTTIATRPLAWRAMFQGYRLVVGSPVPRIEDASKVGPHEYTKRSAEDDFIDTYLAIQSQIFSTHVVTPTIINPHLLSSRSQQQRELDAIMSVLITLSPNFRIHTATTNPPSVM
jgi:hypothetical protein